MSKFIREDLKKFVPYKPNEIAYTSKMNANESPFTLVEEVKQEFVKWLNENENLNIYPETNSDTLRCAIADFYKLKQDNIVCGVGSDELIDCIMKAFLEINESVIISSPTFDMYGIFTQINRGKIIDVPLNNDYSINTDIIIKKAIEDKAKIIFICSPNNPTGNIVTNEDIIKIANNVNSIVVVDEAYAEFSSKSIINEINSLNNVIILRTFSKAFGLAGVRVGYAISNIDLINDINVVKAPFNLSTVSQKLALLCLKYADKYVDRIEYLKNERNRVFLELEKNKNIVVYKSGANFIYVKSKIDIAEKVYEKGILIRKYSDNDDIKIFRITINTKEENDLLIKIIGDL